MVQLAIRDESFVFPEDIEPGETAPCLICRKPLIRVGGHERGDTVVDPYFRHPDGTTCRMATDGGEIVETDDSWAAIRTVWLSDPDDGRKRYLRYAKAPAGSHCLLLHNTQDENEPAETVGVLEPDTRALQRVFWLFERAGAHDEDDGWQTIGTIPLSSPEQTNAAWLTLKSTPSDRFAFQLTKWSGYDGVENVFGGFEWTDSQIGKLRSFFHDVIELDSTAD